MSYLLDRKIKRKRIVYAIISIFVFLVLFYFRSGIWNGMTSVSHVVFRPVLVFGNHIGEKLRDVGSFFASKKSLFQENINLKSQMGVDRALISNYNSILAENMSLKNILGRSDETRPMILATILSKPNQSPYDTMIIDIGLNKGLKTGDIVFALGNVPIGRISDAYSNTSKVVLFSNSGDKTQIVVGDQNVFMEIVGRGGGNFEMILPRDFILTKGDQVVLPGITPYVVGVVETIISDLRDPFIKALLVSPVNIQELKFVQVEIQK